MPLQNKNITILQCLLSIFYLSSLVGRTTTHNENNNKKIFFLKNLKKLKHLPAGVIIKSFSEKSKKK